MSKRWKSGNFDRTKIPSVLHRLTPARAVDSFAEIDLYELREAGKSLILMDVDNTIIEWKREEFSKPLLAWVAQAKDLGFSLCLVSNTSNFERLSKLASDIGAMAVRGKYKPNPDMFEQALKHFGRRADEAIMLGDQLMTDILGANRLGIDAIWVRQMGSHEFAPIKIKRVIEGLLKSSLYRALVTPMDEQSDAPAVEAAKPMPEKTVVHQIIRFGIVGATAFVADWICRQVLMNGIPFGKGLLSESLGHLLKSDWPNLFGHFGTDQKAASPVLFGLASLVAMTVSFFMNRAWTFQVKGKEARLKQARRFYLISGGGYFINLTISTNMLNHLPGSTGVYILVSSAAGAVVAAVWNFLGSRYYAFKS